ncbi:MAG: hypothetical protein RR281_05835, partial [Pseudoflavonifractor sp.]
MPDAEHNQYHEFSPPPPEQAPAPPEQQTSREYSAAPEQLVYAERGHDEPVPARETEQEKRQKPQKRQKSQKPRPSVGKIALQFVSVATAASVVVTAGAVTSGGRFLPGLAAAATAVYEQLAVPAITPKQDALPLPRLTLAFSGSHVTLEQLDAAAPLTGPSPGGE